MFGDQRMRLERFFDSGSVPDLSQELFAMLDPTVANTTQAPVGVTLPPASTVAPYQIGNFDDGSKVFDFKKKDGSPYGSITIEGTKFVFTDPDGKKTIMGGGGGGGGVPVWG